MVPLSTVVAALDPLSQALAADGYAMECSQEKESTLVQIIATSAACEDCLVPQDLMLRMILSQLEALATPAELTQVVLRYPTKSA